MHGNTQNEINSGERIRYKYLSNELLLDEEKEFLCHDNMVKGASFFIKNNKLNGDLIKEKIGSYKDMRVKIDDTREQLQMTKYRGKRYHSLFAKLEAYEESKKNIFK